MSGELYQALRRRSRIYLREAERLGSEAEYDVALVFLEQAAQLAVKSAYAKLLGNVPRGHNLRRLLAYLASVVKEAGRGEWAEEIKSFMSANREQLILLEDAYTQAHYTTTSYSKSEYEAALATVKSLIRLLDSILENGSHG